MALTRLRWLFALVLVVAGVTSAFGEEVPLLGPFSQFGPTFDEAIVRFEERSGITVNVVVATGWGDMAEKTLTMIAGGIPPDVIYSQPRYINEFSSSDVLLSLNSFIERDGIDLSVFPPRAVDFG